MAACVLCEPFSAHEAYQMGILTDVVPALKVDGKFVANPLVETQRSFDEYGRNAYGKSKTGAALKEGKATLIIEAVSNDFRAATAHVEREVTVVLRPPSLSVDSDQHYLYLGMADLVTFSVSGSSTDSKAINP